MKTNDLVAFENEIATEFRAGHITSPIHLSGGNEQQLIEIFKGIQPWDWVLCSWRSHYHCLLKGIPLEQLKAAIMAGGSMALCFPEYKVLSSGIVGGIASIAVGLAWSIQRQEMEDYTGNHTKVYCFLGDMTAETGTVHESMKFASRHDLPITWIIEDNGLSVDTNTDEAWGKIDAPANVRRYKYQRTYPHCGIGTFVQL